MQLRRLCFCTCVVPYVRTVRRMCTCAYAYMDACLTLEEEMVSMWCQLFPDGIFQTLWSPSYIECVLCVCMCVAAWSQATQKGWGWWRWQAIWPPEGNENRKCDVSMMMMIDVTIWHWVKLEWAYAMADLLSACVCVCVCACMCDVPGLAHPKSCSALDRWVTWWAEGWTELHWNTGNPHYNAATLTVPCIHIYSLALIIHTVCNVTML